MLECCFTVEEDGDDGDDSRTLWETSSIRLSASWRCFGCLRRSHEGVEMRSLLAAAGQNLPHRTYCQCLTEREGPPCSSGSAGISSQQQLKNSQLAYDRCVCSTVGLATPNFLFGAALLTATEDCGLPSELADKFQPVYMD